MYEDFNTFLLKLPEDCKNFIAEDCLVFHLPDHHTFMSIGIENRNSSGSQTPA